MIRKLLIIVAVVIGPGLYAMSALAYEEPSYTVLKESGDYEIRRYAPYLVAETRVRGNFRNSGNRAFRILAGYIFGDNVPAEKMAMTAPVVSRKQEAGERMSMTAPVISERVSGDPAESAPQAGEGDERSVEEAYVYQFVMENKYSMETLPAPVDARVQIKTVPGRLLAAKRFSGRWKEASFDKHTRSLLEALQKDGYRVAGEPMLARYNGPFTPWFLRRNEVLVEIELPRNGVNQL